MSLSNVCWLTSPNGKAKSTKNGIGTCAMNEKVRDASRSLLSANIWRTKDRSERIERLSCSLERFWNYCQWQANYSLVSSRRYSNLISLFFLFCLCSSLAASLVADFAEHLNCRIDAYKVSVNFTRAHIQRNNNCVRQQRQCKIARATTDEHKKNDFSFSDFSIRVSFHSVVRRIGLYQRKHFHFMTIDANGFFSSFYCAFSIISFPSFFFLCCFIE